MNFNLGTVVSPFCCKFPLPCLPFPRNS